MRHQNLGRKFGRNTSHRRAMFRNLAGNLVLHERIETTEAKAKELRRIIERLITSLQALAAPADQQSRHMPPHVRHPDELAREFADVLLLTRQCQSHRVGPAQLAALTALEMRLGREPGDAAFWTPEALRDDPAWREVRRLASAALGAVRSRR